jgi:hypothetical protein
MNKSLVTISSALAIVAAGGMAYAEGGSSAKAANANGVPGVELNVGDKAAKDGGLPGVEANIGANGDQRNIDTSNSSATDPRTLGAGPATSDVSSDVDGKSPRVDRS